MQTQSRIPNLRDATFDDALWWFAELQCSNLLFHPEDDPEDIIHISSGEQLFSSGEVKQLRIILNTLEEKIGHDKLIEAAYPIFMKAFGNQLDA